MDHRTYIDMTGLVVNHWTVLRLGDSSNGKKWWCLCKCGVEKQVQGEQFYADMGPRQDGTTLDRIEVNGNYEPGNCRWANAIQQQNNKRNNRVLEFQGRRQTVREWSREVDIHPNTLSDRLDRGWTVERALTETVDITRRWRDRQSAA